jgi:hypothetical protein
MFVIICLPDFRHKCFPDSTLFTLSGVTRSEHKTQNVLKKRLLKVLTVKK